MNWRVVMDSETRSITIESYYAKQPDGFVYYYWRRVGSKSWYIQKTAMKEIPAHELDTTRESK